MKVGENLPEHSPLGASGAYRWMVCPGSPNMSEGIEDIESDFAFEGTIAHALGERCLREDVEPWRFTGMAMNKDGDVIKKVDDPDNLSEGWLMIPADMIDAVQEYLLALSEWHPDRRAGHVEWGFHCSTLHPLYYGRSDFVHVGERTLDVWDYKHGVGIVVEADDNPQLRYYACGVLESMDLWDQVDVVRMHISQPRGFHWKGGHRFSEETPDQLRKWLDKKCVPAMELAEVSEEVVAGSHCQFCPARQRQCPAIVDAMREWAQLCIHGVAVMNGLAEWTDEQLAAFIRLERLSRVILKVAGKQAHGKLSTGHELPGLKLVNGKTSRVFKKGAEEAAIETFGEDKVYSKPSFLSPAQLEALPGGKTFTAEWAFKPEGGTVVTLDSDPRRAIRRSVADIFKPVGNQEDE